MSDSDRNINEIHALLVDLHRQIELATVDGRRVRVGARLLNAQDAAKAFEPLYAQIMGIIDPAFPAGGSAHWKPGKGLVKGERLPIMDEVPESTMVRTVGGTVVTTSRYPDPEHRFIVLGMYSPDEIGLPGMIPDDDLSDALVDAFDEWARDLPEWPCLVSFVTADQRIVYQHST